MGENGAVDCLTKGDGDETGDACQGSGPRKDVQCLRRGCGTKWAEGRRTALFSLGGPFSKKAISFPLS